MPTIKENLKFWNSFYAWPRGGDEWSKPWGGVDMQWYATILPRIHRFLPSKTILEIAPGFGRWTQFLLENCETLIIVDISEKCIKACMERFKKFSHIVYHVNDGRSLNMIIDGSIDFAFSFDALVHADEDVIASYINQLAYKFSNNGIGFIHHSNLGELSFYYSLLKFFGRLRKVLENLSLVESFYDYWRSPNMDARLARGLIDRSGLKCIGQEIVNWNTRSLIDCFTLFTRKESSWSRQCKVVRNRSFYREMNYINYLSQLYGGSDEE